MSILRDELPSIDVTVSSQDSPQLADALMRRKLDLAFMRAEAQMPDLEYKVIVQEPLVVVLPSDHRLASCDTIALQDIVDEIFLGMSDTAPTLQVVINDYLRRAGIDLRPAHKVTNIGMLISLVVSTRGVTLAPAYAKNFLPRSVISRPLAGQAPTIDLVVGYKKANTSSTLQLFLSRLDDLTSSE